MDHEVVAQVQLVKDSELLVGPDDPVVASIPGDELLAGHQVGCDELQLNDLLTASRSSRAPAGGP